MATVTGMTAEKVTELTDAAVVSAAIDPVTGVLTLQTAGGATLTVGNVDNASTIDNAVSKAHPVGSIFLSISPTNPASSLGIGTWVAWGTGRVPVAIDTAQTEFSTVEKTGGEKTHVLSQAEMPSHTHVGASHSHPGAAHTHTINHSHANTSISVQARDDSAPVTGGGYVRVTDVGNVAGGGGTGYTAQISIPSYSGSSGPASAANTGANTVNATGPTGSGSAHNNLQPYITCYMWKRTA